MPGEEVHLEGQAEEPLYPELDGVLGQRLEQRAADTVAEVLLRDGEGPDLGEVVPHDVQRAAPDDLPIDLRDAELLQPLEVGDGVLADEHPAFG